MNLEAIITNEDGQLNIEIDLGGEIGIITLMKDGVYNYHAIDELKSYCEWEAENEAMGKSIEAQFKNYPSLATPMTTEDKLAIQKLK